MLLATHADDEQEGVASALARRARDDSRSSGSRQVVAACAYAAWWPRRHPGYGDLLRDPD